MVLIVNNANRYSERRALRTMFEARKQVFIDLLGWDLPVLAGRFELDQFDDGDAVYLIVTDEESRHLASARLLDTTRPALLDALYPDLVEGDIPRGPSIREITRFCLSRGIGAAMRRRARDMLLVALADYALANGIASYTGVAERTWFDQIAIFGWDCSALGAPRVHEGRPLVALHIFIDETTIGKLAANGIVSHAAIAHFPAEAA
ncbi:acyl-homoserine-lactone synthase [Sphingopyxis sp.]|uniref:acyl-homoserine-lactone synthase n=1 Tax=Sphingopyxis sp. TaxID=1908224 RepID=UPI002FCA15E7